MRSSNGMRLIDAIHDHIRLVDNAVWAVQRAADDLGAVGLDRAAENLYRAIEGLRESADEISSAQIEDVNGQIDHGKQMIGGMLKLALEGCLQPPKKSRAEASEKSNA